MQEIVYPRYKAGVKCHTVVTHIRLHPDEVAVFLAFKWGYAEKIHPGIAEAIKNLKIIFWGAGTNTPDGKPWEDWHERGYVLVGVGGSPYDEHILPEDHNECAFTLVAKAIGIDNAQKYPQFQEIIRAIHKDDTEGNDSYLSFSSMLKDANALYFDKSRENALEVVRTAISILDWKFVRQVQFFTTTKQEYEGKARRGYCTYNGRKISITTIVSDDEQIDRYARSKYGNYCDMVVVKNSKGHIYVSTRDKANINLDEVIRRLRLEELYAQNEQPNLKDEVLTSVKAYPKAELWHYHKPAGKIMNGSPSSPGTRPTRLHFGLIVDVIKGALAATVEPQQEKSSPKEATIVKMATA